MKLLDHLHLHLLPSLVLLAGACTTEQLDLSITEEAVLSSPLNLSNTSAPSKLAYNFGKNVAIDGRGQVHVVWNEGTATNTAVAYRRSADDGVTWSPTALWGVSPFTGGARVAASGDDVYITWHGVYEGFLRIYLVRSTNAGATFSAPIPISDASIGAAHPTIAASGAEVHVVWGDNRAKTVGGVQDTHSEIYARSSKNHGATFAATVPVSIPDHRSSWTPAVATQGGLVHVAWTDERWDTRDCADVGDSVNCFEEEYYRRSITSGATWGPEVRLTTDAGAPKSSWAPSIVASGPNVHVAYFDFRTGVARIYYQRSTDFGATWPAQATGEQLISNPTDTLPSARPVLSAVGDHVRMVYWRGPTIAGAADIFFAANTAGGAAGSWIGPFPLTANIGQTTATAIEPSVALSQTTGANHVMYMDNRSGNDEIYHLSLK